MSETANLKIVAPDANSVLVPLHSHFAALASTVDDAITSRFQVKQLRYETDAQRTADYNSSGLSTGKPDLVDGDMCLVNTNKRQFIWNFNGTTGAWQPLAKRFVFASISERDAVPVADIFEGDTCYVTATNVEYYWDGSAWVDRDETGLAWKDWTPTLSGWTGATVNYARYKQYGKTVHYTIKVTGSTTAPSVFTITVPSNMTGNSTVTEQDMIAGMGTLRMGSIYQITNLWTSATVMRPMAITGATGTVGYLSATVPTTYASGAVLRLSGTYEIA